MVVDASALVAIERREWDAQRFEDALYQAGGAALSAVSFVEFCMVVIGDQSQANLADLDRKLQAQHTCRCGNN